MASAIIHLCIAKKINETLKVNEKPFILGSIAPDLSKQVGESKKNSHFLTTKKNDVPNIKEFLNKYESSLNNPFNLGYFVHLYTDKLWFDEFLRSRSFENCIKLLDGSTPMLTEEEIRRLIYNDYTNLNISLIDEYELNLSLFYEDLIIPNTTIDEIAVDKLQLLIDKMGIIIMNSKEEKSYVFDIVAVNEFIEYCSKKIIRKISEYNIKVHQ
jgi:hypothetical protein